MQLLEIAAGVGDDEILEQHVYEGHGVLDRMAMNAKTNEKRTINQKHETAVYDLIDKLADEYCEQMPSKNKGKIIDKYKDTVAKSIKDNRVSAVIYLGTVKDADAIESVLIKDGFRSSWTESDRTSFYKNHYWKTVGGVTLNAQFNWNRYTYGSTDAILHGKKKVHISIWSSKKK